MEGKEGRPLRCYASKQKKKRREKRGSRKRRNIVFLPDALG